MKERLEAVLRPVLGDVSVENLHALTGGASRTTWAFEALSDQRRSLILRTGPPDDVHAGMELEAAVQKRAAAAGAPVPHILAADNSAAALGHPYLICDAIAGSCGEPLVTKKSIHPNWAAMMRCRLHTERL